MTAWLCLLLLDARLEVLAARALPAAELELRWTHSVEQLPWSERYRLGEGALYWLQSRVEGSGAGMEPPPDARPLAGGGWVYGPPSVAAGRRDELRLAVSEAVEPWQLCLDGDCFDWQQPFAAVPSAARTLALRVSPPAACAAGL